MNTRLAWNHFWPISDHSCDKSLTGGQPPSISSLWSHLSSNTPKTHTQFPSFSSGLAVRQTPPSMQTDTHSHTNSICWLSNFWFHVGSGHLPMSKSMTPQNNKNSSNYTSSLTNVCLPWLSWPCLCVCWVHPSGLFPPTCSHSGKNAPLPFSHVSQDKMVSTVAILRASKKITILWSMGKANKERE